MRTTLTLLGGMVSVVLVLGSASSLTGTNIPSPAHFHEPPFILPFAEAPGPSTWYLTQYYGNTQSAYHWRIRYYEAGQGLHFGLDFAARCGTEVVAIGDGEVVGIDVRQRGSGPHNLLIYHEEENVTSLYGHLLEAPVLYIGQSIEQGQVVALSGDPDLSCTSRPHLHLEIRSRRYSKAYNPVDFIDTDWDTLALFGPSHGFQRDLKNPRRWVSAYDQPEVDFWEPMLNDYDQPWPPDWE